jgi:hypothetical protein
MFQETEFARQPYQHENRASSDIGAYKHASGGAWSKLAVEPASEEHAEAAEIKIDARVFVVVAAFRRHPHINNVMTHISGGSWDRVEQALRAILDPLARTRDLSQLARNIVDLMCADRGVTGRILKPYFRDLLATVLPLPIAARLRANVTCLFLEFELASSRVTGALRSSTNRPIIKGESDVGGCQNIGEGDQCAGYRS